MGLYHSLFEWFNPLYLNDKHNNGQTNAYVTTILQPQLRDIVNSYQPEIIWADGDWEMNDTYWQSKEFLAWLYNESPVKNSVVVNDRWGSGDTCVNGGYWTCEDRYNPHQLVNHKWENCMTIDYQTWGYARNHNISYYLSIETLLDSLMSTVAYGGNLLLNVGPTADGRIAPVFQERLLQMGEWLAVNGEGVYETHPWRSQNQTVKGNPVSRTGYYTSKGKDIYFTMFNWPESVLLVDPVPVSGTSQSVQLLGVGNLQFSVINGGGVNIILPKLSVDQLPSKWAWMLKLTGFQ